MFFLTPLISDSITHLAVPGEFLAFIGTFIPFENVYLFLRQKEERSI